MSNGNANCNNMQWKIFKDLPDQRCVDMVESGMAAFLPQIPLTPTMFEKKLAYISKLF